jgi:trehalose 6-phosphate synthase
MSVAARFVLPLLVVLAILTGVSSRAIERITDGWVERDLSTRADLAVSSARDSLVPAWQESNRAHIQRFLNGLLRDERIVGAAACDVKERAIATTTKFPGPLTCERLGRDLWRHGGTAAPAATHSWFGAVPLYGQEVHVSVVPLFDDAGEPLGFVALVHDLRFEEQRRTTIQRILLFAFATLTAVASLLMAIVARLSWHNWLRYVRRLLRGDKGAAEEATARPEFSPIAQDVRELIARIGEDERTGPRGRWTPERLRQVLRSELVGEKAIIVANREPYIHERVPRTTNGGSGGGDHAEKDIVVRFPASGLVSALEPVMRACSGVWIAHGSGSADRETADANGRLRVPPGEDAYTLRRVWLSREEESGYYFGFSNEGLWPLCHYAHARPIFRADDWAYYQEVNQKFADAVCDEADTEDPIVLVQDYHFALVPQLVRRRLPRATILTFWHIPWPNAESFGICPWRNQILQGLLGSSILGFHTRLHCNNFIDAIDRYIEARIDREDLAVFHEGQMTAVRAYPISIEWPSRWLSQLPAVAECRRSVIEELGLHDDALIGVGVDRIDYTKGIEERFLAVESLLEHNPDLRGRFTFVELGAPSRTEIPRYHELEREIEELAARINQRFGTESNGGSGYRPIILLRAQHQPLTVFRYFRAADLCYVSSLHDGMNLVAKEFVSARDDDRGVLILSDFTGAARELTEALIVNPYDIRQASSALAAALHMSPDEQAERMHAMRALVSELNVYRWAGHMLLDAARQRRRERLNDRLAESQSHASPPLF